MQTVRLRTQTAAFMFLFSFAAVAPAQNAGNLPGRMNFIGTQSKPELLQIIKQSMEDQRRLSDALAAIVPITYDVHVQAALEKYPRLTRLSTKAGESWDAALSRFAVTNNLYVLISHDHKAVFVRAQPFGSADIGRIQQAMDTQTNAVAAQQGRPGPSTQSVQPAGASVTTELKVLPAGFWSGAVEPARPALVGQAMPIAPIASVEPPKPIEPPKPSFQVLDSDHTLRDVLERWAKAEGYTFGATLWELPRDLPIAAQARFQGSFKESVLDLMKATHSSDTPGKPCFHANAVLRIVPITQSCQQPMTEQKLSAN